MKAVVVGVLLAMIAPKVHAQAFENGGNVITLGFGVDPYYRSSYKGNWGNGYRYTEVGPIILTYERGITELLGIGRLGVGGGVGQSFYTSKWYNGSYESKERTSRTALFARCAYHFDFGIDKMDVYAGVGAATYIYSRTYTSEDPFDTYYKSKGARVDGGPILFGGIRYYFTNSFGVYAEAGYGMSAFNGGLSFKF